MQDSVYRTEYPEGSPHFILTSLLKWIELQVKGGILKHMWCLYVCLYELAFGDYHKAGHFGMKRGLFWLRVLKASPLLRSHSSGLSCWHSWWQRPAWYRASNGKRQITHAVICRSLSPLLVLHFVKSIGFAHEHSTLWLNLITSWMSRDLCLHQVHHPFSIIQSLWGL